MHYPRSSLIACAALLALGGVDAAASSHHESQELKPRQWGNHWVTAWGTMPQMAEPHNLPPAPFNETGLVFPNSTIRQTVQVSSEADYIRLRLSNVFGGSDLPITAATIAAPASDENDDGAGTPAIDTNTLQKLRFSGSESFIVPNGAQVVSDPLQFKVKPESIVTITLYLEEGQATNEITSHPGSRTNSWFSFGNYVDAANMTDPSTASAAHWYFISAIDAWTPDDTASFVIVGDSITDGRGSDTNMNNRWPDLLLKNMQQNPDTAHISVINQAAGGNRILRDGLGPNALGRIDRDVLAQSAVKYAMIFEGVNDIGTADTTEEAQQAVGDRVIAALKQIAVRVHAQGIPMFAATITPFMAPEGVDSMYADPEREKTRQRVNKWIRESDTFDAVIDFDKALRDPEEPSQLKEPYQFDDYLHFNVAGNQVAADSFPLEVFSKFAQGVNRFQ